MKSTIIDEGTHYWSTEPHSDNIETMTNFLEQELPGDINVTLVDDTYAEIRINKLNYSVNVSGNGDFCNHKAEFELIH